MAGSSGSGPEGDEELDDLEVALLEEIEDAADAGRGSQAQLRALRGRAYLRAVPEDLRAVADVLERLLGLVEADPRWTTLLLQPPLAIGPGADPVRLRLTCDPAAGVGVPEAVVELVRRSGTVVDVLVHAMPGSARGHTVAAELGEGVRMKLDVRAAPAGRLPGAVVLHDAEDPHDPSAARRDDAAPAATPAQARAWLFAGWWALADANAAIARGSFLQAADALGEVRRAVCRLWAVGEGVPDPHAGLDSLIGQPAARPPKGLEALVPRPLPAELRTAVVAAADLLHDAANHAGRRLGQVPRTGLEPAVRRRLSARR